MSYAPISAGSITTTTGIFAANNTLELLPVVSDIIRANPEINFFNAAATSKNAYYSLFVKTLPVTGFREPGNDRTYSAGEIGTRLHELKNFDASWQIECALAKQYDRGSAWACALQQKIHLESAMFKISQQIWYGDSDSGSYGFDGLYKFAQSYSDEKCLNVNSGKTFTDGSSVFFVCNGEEFVTINWGEDGALKVGDIHEQMIGNTSTGRYFFGQHIEGWVGLQNLSKHSVVKISGLSATGTLTGLSDSLLAQALRKFPVGVSPSAIFMSRRSLGQLQESRYGKSYTPTGLYAPVPTEFNGIPIIVTDAIVDNENYDNLYYIDTTAPTVTLSGDSSVSVVTDATWSDPGATATDNHDLSLTIVKSYKLGTTSKTSFDSSQKGTWTITYTATDNKGNKGSVVRTVTVADAL